MSFSNVPDYILIRAANLAEDSIQHWVCGVDIPNDYELQARQPDIAAYYFGDCEGQPIISEMMGYGDGKEIWTDTN